MQNAAQKFRGPPGGGMAMLTVGAILKEPLETTLRFVSWYLDAGADQIVLCFDDPLDPAIEILRDHPKVRCIRCTRSFWINLGCRPRTRFTRRQNRAMQYVYDGLTEGWFLNVDGDELAYVQGRNLRNLLAAQPDEVRSVTLRPAEAIQCPQTPHLQFRLAMSDEACGRVYGDLAPFMVKRRGLSGHTIGKTATRAGLVGFQMRQHFMQGPDGERVLDQVLGHGEGAYVLHFFDQGYDIWRSKLNWRLSSRGFRENFKDHLRACLNGPDTEERLREIYNRLHVFDEDRMGLLELLQSRLEVRLNMAGLVEDYFPGRLVRAA